MTAKMPDFTAGTIATPAPAAQRLAGLRIPLIIVAFIEAFDALPSAVILLGDMSEIPDPGIGDAIIKAHLATHSAFPRSWACSA
jgi:hypothetical protein